MRAAFLSAACALSASVAQVPSWVSAGPQNPEVTLLRLLQYLVAGSLP